MTESKVKLTTNQAITLRHLARIDWERDGCPSGSELSRIISRTLDRSWAGPKLRELEKNGLAERVGVTFQSGTTWRITPAGRLALSQEGRGE